MIGAFVSLGSLASAVTVQTVSGDSLIPGGEGLIRMEVENILNRDVEDVSIRLIFDDLPLTPIGSSEEGVDELEDGEEETFGFRIRADNDIVPGNYRVPYILRYDDNGVKEREGSIGVRVTGNIDLAFSTTTETPVIGQEGTINLKITNKGFADARFVSVRIFPEGFTTTSESDVYVGNVDSDDFETVSFDVIFNNRNARVVGIVEYRNFENKLVTRNIDMPLEVYTNEEALELGIIERSNTVLYVSIVIVLLVLWFVWRAVRKRRRKKRSEGR